MALRMLHLQPDAPLWAAVAVAVYKAAVKHSHPDAGGDTKAMVAINRAVEIIRDYAQEGAAGKTR